MTPKERAAIQQALEALESYSKSDYIKKQHPKRRANGEKAIIALREALDHIADSDKMVTTPKLTLPKQGKCKCGDKCFPIFSGNREYCETCGWPLVSFEEQNPNKVDEEALLEALAKQARHLNVEPVKLFTSDNIKVAFENGYAAAMSVADVAKETEQEPILLSPSCAERGCACFDDRVDGEPVTAYLAPVQPVKQEPVAIDGLARACNLAGIDYKDFLRIKAYLPIAAPVRTKDLTDDEIMKINVDTAGIVPTCDRQFHFARAVIAADREKNK